MDLAWQHVRLAFRGLRRAPGFTYTTILTLALGIGATTAVFSVVNGVLLQPLPFEHADELVSVWQTAPGVDLSDVSLSDAMGFTYRDENRVFQDIGFWTPLDATVTGRSEPQQIRAVGLSAGLLPVLGVRPVIGRLVEEQDDTPGAPPVVLLSESYWKDQWGGDAGVLGTTLRVDGVAREVVGVLPTTFVLPREEPSIYVPLQWDRAKPTLPWRYHAVGRLLPGATLEEARADVERMIPLVPERFPGALSPTAIQRAQLAPNLRPLKQDFVGDIGNVLWVLFGAVGIVFLMACVNVANLFAVRAERSHRELAVRAALGAERSQIVGQLLLESLVLGLLGGLGGLGLATGAVRLLTRIGPESLPWLEGISLDANVLGFAFAISVVGALLFGLAPMLHVCRLSLVGSLKAGGAASGGRRFLGRNVLVVAEIAMALILLAGCGLMVRSFQALSRVDPGFADPDSVLTFRIAIPSTEIQDDAEALLAYQEVWRRLNQISGVTSVGASTSVTMDGRAFISAVAVDGFPVNGPDGAPPSRRFKWVTGDYFETMRNPVLAGRAIEWRDIEDKAPVAVVTADFAEQYWGGARAAIGKRIAPNRVPWRDIIGVVGSVHDAGVDQPAPQVIYWPLGTTNDGRSGLTYVVRAGGVSPPSLLPDVGAAVRSVNANIPVTDVRTLAELVARDTAPTSFTLVLLSIAASVALLLGVIGIYGVISYVAAQRTREIGIRIALGAQGRAVRWLVLKRGIVLATIGVLIGSAAAAGLTRLLASVLYGVGPTDPGTFAAVIALLATVAVIASYLPALHASRTDPLEALRSE